MSLCDRLCSSFTNRHALQSLNVPTADVLKSVLRFLGVMIVDLINILDPYPRGGNGAEAVAGGRDLNPSPNACELDSWAVRVVTSKQICGIAGSLDSDCGKYQRATEIANGFFDF